MEADPENSNFADWPAEMSFPGNGVVTMEPNGPTDFGLGKNIASFSDSIGGCGMSFADSVARGYTFKADDPRDLEIKCVCTFDGIQSGNDMSISSRTGHHTSDNCCQGFAYMAGFDCNTNRFRFRKEMWHVSYHESPEGDFTHSAFTADYNGGKKIGLGLTIYNKPGSNNTRVVLEFWGNPDPVANATNWIMIKRIEDFSGNGWGDDGGDCDGEDDQFGPWSGPQSRFKTNSTSGSIDFESVSMREIDPSRALDDTNPPPPPPGEPPVVIPPPQGGGTNPSTITPLITYTISNAKTVLGPTDTDIVGYTRVNHATRIIAAQMIGAMVDPDPFSKFGPSGWRRNTTTQFDIQQNPCSANPTDNKKYPDGLGVTTYWSNSANLCVGPGVLADGTVGTDANDVINHGGRILKNPKIHLIFWGDDWNDRTETPTKDQIISEIRDKLLGSDKSYFNDIQQYGSPGIPTWGQSGTGTTTTGGTPTPTTGNELVIPLPKYRDANDSRPIINMQMRLPNNTWSQSVLFNFDTGATFPTYIPLELLSAFGFGVNGSESGSPQNVTIRIPGLTGEYTIPVQVQDKSHYDLMRSQPAPIRYPLVRIRDLLQHMSFVLTKDNVIIRTAATAIPELNASGKIVLPNMTSRSGTPTSGYQWMHVDFVNPSNPSDTVDDWFGLNTGDQRIIVRAARADDINLTLHPPVDNDAQEHSAICNIRFKEATPSTLITDNTIVVRDETADFGSGGGPRSYGSGFQFLNKYKMVLHGASLQRELIPLEVNMSVILSLVGSSKAGLTHRQTFGMNTAEEMIEGMTDPWQSAWNAESTNPNDPIREIGDDPCDTITGGDFDHYADGFYVEAYWSNSDNNCVIPGISTTPVGGSHDQMVYKGGPVMKNPKIWLIFWGADWETRVTTPTKAELIADIQNKLLGTDTQYFNKLSQYGSPGIPVWAGAVQNNNILLSTDTTEVINKDATIAAAIEDVTAAIRVISDCLNRNIIPLAGVDFNNTQFIVVPEYGRLSLWYGACRSYASLTINTSTGAASASNAHGIRT